MSNLMTRRSSQRGPNLQQVERLWSAVAQVRGRGYSLKNPQGEVVVTIHGKRDLHAYAGQIAAAMNLTTQQERQARMLSGTGYDRPHWKMFEDRWVWVVNGHGKYLVKRLKGTRDYEAFFTPLGKRTVRTAIYGPLEYVKRMVEQPYGRQ